MTLGGAFGGAIGKKNCGAVWGYAALCGPIRKAEKIEKYKFLIFPGKSGKAAVALCGTMWRYVALSGKLKKLKNTNF